MIKRTVDILGAGIGLLLLFPVLTVLAIVVRLTMGSPVFFSQVRPGRLGRPFWMYKFRTMTDSHDDAGNPLPDKRRLTRTGQFLRRTSLDELPELWNVLKGDMSLVGPRPLLMKYMDRYAPEQARRHEVKPGMTGLAQVSGRNAIEWEKKFELDVWYVDHMSLMLDLKILFRTVVQILRRDGICAESHATMPEFMGTGKNDGGA